VTKANTTIINIVLTFELINLIVYPCKNYFFRCVDRSELSVKHFHYPILFFRIGKLSQLFFERRVRISGRPFGRYEFQRIIELHALLYQDQYDERHGSRDPEEAMHKHYRVQRYKLYDPIGHIDRHAQEIDRLRIVYLDVEVLDVGSSEDRLLRQRYDAAYPLVLNQIRITRTVDVCDVYVIRDHRHIRMAFAMPLQQVRQQNPIAKFRHGLMFFYSSVVFDYGVPDEENNIAVRRTN
jgi:hypothetical protein